ncbi:Os08g0482900 [Oryza sativa Japonica Group]|uniref:Os08g0482900 protein n=1 Tax=Oryza sativa subsp. japonica TaxID=39947 RepID=A0A0P0XGY4_ORYSJ|nr:Os08g0482900 [Oryza sativa Japonica Group]
MMPVMRGGPADASDAWTHVAVRTQIWQPRGGGWGWQRRGRRCWCGQRPWSTSRDGGSHRARVQLQQELAHAALDQGRWICVGVPAGPFQQQLFVRRGRLLHELVRAALRLAARARQGLRR